MSRKIKISNIKIEPNNIPEDRKLIELLKQAYSGELLVRMALIQFDVIRPFFEYRPQISASYKSYFEEAEDKKIPPPFYVYPETDHFIMSDDYNAYYTYKEKGYLEVMCVLLGESDSGDIIEKSEPFELPQPEVEQL